MFIILSNKQTVYNPHIMKILCSIIESHYRYRYLYTLFYVHCTCIWLIFFCYCCLSMCLEMLRLQSFIDTNFCTYWTTRYSGITTQVLWILKNFIWFFFFRSNNLEFIFFCRFACSLKKKIIITQVTKSIISLLHYYNWRKFSIIHEELWTTVAKSLENEAKSNNMTINHNEQVIDNHKCCENDMQCCRSGYWYQV